MDGEGGDGTDPDGGEVGYECVDEGGGFIECRGEVGHEWLGEDAVVGLGVDGDEREGR